jgi:hypothetical protein
MPMSFPFLSWGEELATNALPWYYVPSQFLARLPEGFLVLLAFGLFIAIATASAFMRRAVERYRKRGAAGLRVPALALARSRGALVVIAAAIVPVAFVMITRATHYDGVRHVLFVIPMLALLAGGAFVRFVPLLRNKPLITTAVVAAIVAHVCTTVVTLFRLHPLEYVAINTIAGGTKAAAGRFELDYWSASVGEALRLLEHRLDNDASGRFALSPPRVLICMHHREWVAGRLFRRNWILELDRDKADFIIDTERLPCGKDSGAILLDEVRRLDVSFARIYGNNRGRPD